MVKSTETKIKVSELIPDDKNFNKGSEFGNSLISKSFEKFGAGRSILIDKNNKIIAGNKSTENYGAGGGEDVIVVESDGTKLIAVKRTDIDLDTPEGRELALADNATAKANIVWAEDVIASELGVEIGESWGVDMGKEIPEAEEDDFDTTPPEEPKTVLGDLYEIGEHRLLCGDSTDSDQVARLMNGEKADMVFTDPPYGNGSSGKYGRGQLGVRTILNDDTFECVNNFFNLRICDAYVFFLQWRTFKEAIQTLENNDLTLKTIAVWDKKNAGLNGAGGMAEQWEAIIVAGNIKYSRFGGNVFNVSREQKKRIDSPHPHQKPIKLLSDILDYFKDYKLLVDPFSGSGSTMVASHQLKRKCYGMELDPKYCDVIVKRMITLDPTLTIKLNGVDVTSEWKS